MNRALNIQKYLILFGIPIMIIGMLIILAKSSLFKANPNALSIGITVDLLITVPVIYLILVRKTNIPRATFVPFVIAGMIICSLILPVQNQYYLDLFKTWVFPIIEVSILLYIIYNLSKAIKQYKLKKNKTIDFYTALKSTCYDILPKGLVIPVVTEIAVFYYGFIYWKRKKLNENEYSYHKDSGTVTLLIAIILIVAIETLVLHILIEKWSTIAAWILTFLSIYSGIQLFGFLKSMYKRPISIENDKLFIRYGIMNEAIIDIKNIENIEVSTKTIELNKNTRKLSFLGELESHNVIIKLKVESTFTGLYGIKKQYKTLVLYVDKKIEFVNRINNDLQHFV